MNWGIGADIPTLPCVRQLTSWNLLNTTGRSVHCQRGGMGGGSGREVQKGGDIYAHVYVYVNIYVYIYFHFIVQQKLTQHCKATIPAAL